MVHPGGPSSQRRTSPGLVNASNTNRRGASKSRVTRTSRSLGVDTLKLSGKNMEPPLPLLGSGPIAFLFRGFQLAQQAVKPHEGSLPIFAVPFQPLGCFSERAPLELARSPLRISPPDDKPRTFEHIEVLGNRRLTQIEGLHQFRYIRLP